MLPDCRLEETFAAQHGVGAPDPHRLRSPARPGHRRRAGKDVYGEDLAHHLDGVNFTVQWADGDADEDVATAVLDAAEEGWATLIDEGGWPLPVSSDAHLLWIILDPGLGGTGTTAEYVTDDYPDGYPILYVNPVYYADYPDFVRSVAVHELGHAIQYALRDATTASGEFWYWEASAEWMAELGAPSLDEYARSSSYYASQTALAHDSVVDGHAYGMFVLNASLAEDTIDLQEVWSDNGGVAWEDRIAALTGEDFGTVIGTMAARYDAAALRESPLYEAPTVISRATVPLGEEVSVQTWGSAIYRIADLTGWALTGPVRADFVVDGEVVDTPPDSGPADVILTRLEAGDIRFGDDAVATEDTGKTPAGGCACTQGLPSPAGSVWGAGLLAVALSRRARGAPRPRSPARRAGTPGAGSPSPAPS